LKKIKTCPLACFYLFPEQNCICESFVENLIDTVLYRRKANIEDIYNLIIEDSNQPASKTELSSTDSEQNQKGSPDEQLQTKHKQSISSDMSGACEDSDLDSEIDKPPKEFEPKPFIGPLDLLKKFQQSPASPTPINESNTKRQQSKPKRFSEEHEKYYEKGTELDTFILYKSLLINQQLINKLG
jgi:hypothetical protein